MHSFRGEMLVAFFALTSTAAYPEGSTGTQRFYEVRGAKLYTETFGHGQPILFLHGGMLFFDNTFTEQRDYFAAYRTVIGIDQRGHGRLRAGQSRRSRSLDDHVEQVLLHVDRPRRD